ncbi:MAG: hypothetical protein J6L81_03715 [Clostridia bacterium]|nr:hypothetical protein [Clostridia bacterium]
MKRIRITDATLSAAAARQDMKFSYKEKVDLCKTFDRLRVDTICLAPIVNEKVDSLLTKTISSVVTRSVLSMPVGYTAQSVDVAWDAISKAAKPQLYVGLPVSTIQMEYLCHKKPQKMLELIKELVEKSCSLCDRVEFAAEDATRAEFDFLCSAIDTAIAAGATAVTVCDTAGTMMPDEFTEFIDNIHSHVPALDDVELGVRCSDQLHIAAACAVSAVRSSASAITVTADGGIAPSLESISAIISNRGEYYDIQCGLRSTELKHAVGRILGSVPAFSSAADVNIDDSGIVFDKNDDLAAITKAIADLGYDLSEDDCARVYESFSATADKKTVGKRELEAIIAAVALQVPQTYNLVSFVINSGNKINATSCVELEKDGEILRGFSTGDGSIDASFRAIEQIVGRHYELDDFQIQSVTQGREAMGSAVVKLRSEGKLYSGNGISTDIIGASIRAYVSALNKIAYES